MQSTCKSPDVVYVNVFQCTVDPDEQGKRACTVLLEMAEDHGYKKVKPV